MAADNNLKVNELDFNSIKINFKNYLKSQDEFRDYNFEASGISTLLDLLSYNTYYNAFYLNMVASEAFLSTAQKRNTVVNLAKSLNYIPRSTSAAKISGTITVIAANSPTSITIPKNTEFTGQINDSTFSFLTQEAITVYSQENYTGNVILKEGTPITRRYVVSFIDPEQRFLIPNPNVDTSTISVRVTNSSVDSATRTFIQPNNLVEINNNSGIYFLEEVEDGQFEIKFGDGSFGVSLNDGNIITIEYLVTNGKDANDVLNLTYNDSILNVTSINFSASDPSSGGSERESISSIKFNAPKSYTAQNRVVTAEDYKALLLKQSTVNSVIVWGGEDNDPPEYGKVFIAVKPTVGNSLTATEKENLIKTIIKPKKILTISTEIVDPEYMYLLIDITSKYNSDETSLTEGDLISLIQNVVSNYNSVEINSFSKYFRFSKLNRLIDFADRSILNSDLSISMRIEQNVSLNVPTRYEISFSNPIDNSTEGRPSTHPYGFGNKLTSNSFAYNGFEDCYLEENNGILRIYRTIRGLTVGVLNTAGTLDYTTGKIILNSFAPSSFYDGSSTLKLTAIPKNKDILPLRKQIIQIRDSDVTITMLDDKTINLLNR
jgi:hypothetical protein